MVNSLNSENFKSNLFHLHISAEELQDMTDHDENDKNHLKAKENYGAEARNTDKVDADEIDKETDAKTNKEYVLDKSLTILNDICRKY